MNFTSVKLTLLLINIFLISTLYSQDKVYNDISTQLKPNAVYASLGFGVANLNYERKIFEPKKKSFFTSYWAKVGGGLWAEFFGGEGGNLTLGLTALTGSKKSHLEVGLGLTGLYDKVGYNIGVSNANYPIPGIEPEPSKSDYIDIRPAAALGYRFQKPNGKFIFRIGIGYPEFVYLGFGFCF